MVDAGRAAVSGVFKLIINLVTWDVTTGKIKSGGISSGCCPPGIIDVELGIAVTVSFGAEFVDTTKQAPNNTTARQQLEEPGADLSAVGLQQPLLRSSTWSSTAC